MLAVEWWFWAALLISLALVASAILGFKLAGKVKLRILRWSLRLVCVPLGILGSLAAVLLVAGQGCVSHSAMIYSPSRKLGAMIYVDDLGATGGNTFVELFWAHGLRQATVFYGDWAAVKPSEVRWNGDSQLFIPYDGTIYRCDSTSAVKVICSAKGK